MVEIASDQVTVDPSAAWLTAELEWGNKLPSDRLLTDEELAKVRSAMLTWFDAQKGLGERSNPPA